MHLCKSYTNSSILFYSLCQVHCFTLEKFVQILSHKQQGLKHHELIHSGECMDFK